MHLFYLELISLLTSGFFSPIYAVLNENETFKQRLFPPTYLIWISVDKMDALGMNFLKSKFWKFAAVNQENKFDGIFLAPKRVISFICLKSNGKTAFLHFFGFKKKFLFLPRNHIN